MNKVYYHVRAANGCTIDWLQSGTSAIALAHELNAQCFEVNSVTGRAQRIV